MGVGFLGFGEDDGSVLLVLQRPNACRVSLGPLVSASFRIFRVRMFRCDCVILFLVWGFGCP